MNLKVYVYDKCSTCRKALKFLDQNQVQYTKIPIRDTPPSQRELKSMLASYEGQLRRLFNTSGQDYRQLNIKEKLPTMSAGDAVKLLSGNGNLIKRPFAISDEVQLVGFDEATWKERLGL